MTRGLTPLPEWPGVVADRQRELSVDGRPVSEKDDGVAVVLLLLPGPLRVVHHRAPVTHAPFELALPVMRTTAGRHHVGCARRRLEERRQERHGGQAGPQRARWVHCERVGGAYRKKTAVIVMSL